METWEAGRDHLLDLLAQGATMREVLSGLCDFVESTTKGCMCSVLLLDQDGLHLRHAAAPSLPEDYCRAVDGLAIGPRVGSCGTAAFLGQEVVVEDIATDPLWAECKSLGLEHELAACASTPILGPGRKVMGTFALYHSAPGPFKESELERLRSAMGLAAIAIQIHDRETALRQTEGRFSAMVKHSRDFISVNDSEGKFRFVSPAGAAFFGFSPEELVGHVAFDFVHPDDLPIVLGYHMSLHAGAPGPVSVTFRARSADGTWRWLEVFGSTYADPSTGLCTVLNGRDVTEQKRLEDQLKTSEARYRSIVQALPDEYFRVHADGTILDAVSNGIASTFLGWNPKGRKLQETPLPKELLTLIANRISCACLTQEVQVLEYDFTTAEPPTSWEARFSPCGLEEVVVFVRDISERKRAESALKMHLDGEHLVSKLSTDLVRIVPTELAATIGRCLEALGRFLSVDRCHINLLSQNDLHFDRSSEWCAEGVESWKDRQQRVPCDHYPWLLGHLRNLEDVPITKLHAPPVATTSERDRLLAQGICSMLTVPVRQEGRLLGFLSLETVQRERTWRGDDLKFLRLVSELLSSALERRRMEQALQDSERRYRELVEKQGEGIVTVDPEERVTFANPSGERIFGVPPGTLVGRSMREFVSEEEFAKLVEQTALRRRGAKACYEFAIRRPDGEGRTLLLSATPILDAQGGFCGAHGILVDITERKHLEERLERTRFHESLAMVAGGVAHHVNNLLATIQTNTELIRLGGADSGPWTAKIIQAVQRAAELSQQMLATAGHDQASPEFLDINLQLELLKHGFPQAFPDGPPIILDRSGELPKIKIDPRHLQQVIYALVSNACEAIGDREGRITLSTGLVRLDVESIANLPPDQELGPGDFVSLRVQDNGCGIDPAVRTHIFEPFFSTKFIGRGLGLSSASGILKASGAGIHVESEVGKGSTFTIYFPATPQIPEPAPESEQAGEGREAGSMILLVDDEELLRSSTAEILRFQGFEVLEAADGMEAVELFQSHQHELAAVILDLCMPRMNGYEALQTIREIDPNARVILSSGYSEQDAMKLIKGSPCSAFLQKPYAFEALKAVLKKVIDRSG